MVANVVLVNRLERLEMAGFSMLQNLSSKHENRGPPRKSPKFFQPIFSELFDEYMTCSIHIWALGYKG